MKTFISRIIQIFRLIAIAIALYFLAFFIVVIVKDVRIRVKTRIDVNTKYFDISAIVDTNKHCITEDYTTFYDEAFVCYDCIIDSVYHFSISKIGVFDRKGNLGDYSLTNDFIIDRHRNRHLSVISPIHFSPDIDIGYLPNESVEKILLYVDGEILSKTIVRDNFVVVKMFVGSFACSFNDHDSQDLYYTNVTFEKRPSYMFFFKDDKNILFIGVSDLPLVESTTENPV